MEKELLKEGINAPHYAENNIPIFRLVLALQAILASNAEVNYFAFLSTGLQKLIPGLYRFSRSQTHCEPWERENPVHIYAILYLG